MEEEIRELRKDIKEMAAQLNSMQAMLSGSVLDELAVVRKRLDKHSDRLDALERTQHEALTMKSMFVWMVATVLTAIGIGVSVVELVLK